MDGEARRWWVVEMEMITAIIDGRPNMDTSTRYRIPDNDNSPLAVAGALGRSQPRFLPLVIDHSWETGLSLLLLPSRVGWDCWN